MKKFLKIIDDNLLRFGVAFAILFTALYPKLPSIQINHTWVYIRLEDFVILLLAFIWFIQLLRKKVSLPKPEGYALVIYWIIGLISLGYCLVFVAPHLTNFFPNIAALQYLRRIEYMILFFVAFSTIKEKKDLLFYVKALCVTVLGVVLYGFGQRFYFILWHFFPKFFEKNPFCFPAFLTGNEEFAKGTPLCLNEMSRISSTFGGHYDLAAYLVFVIPILIALVFAVKKTAGRIFLIVLSIFALELLNFTSSRTSFAAYVLAISAMLVMWKKAKWIIPILIVSLGVMLVFSNSTLQRYSKTIQQVQIVSVDTNNGALPSDLQKIIADTKKADDLKHAEVPPASEFTVGAQKPVVASTSSDYTTVLTNDQLKDVAISSVSGSFLMQKAYALDVSFTTRFQAEWPRNWKAFLNSPAFGTGYSSLTLATDNDYLRALGETGAVGLVGFLFMFVVLGIFAKNAVSFAKDDLTKAFIFGLVGGTIGLLINATLIDVFEASKVAEPMWILMGIGVGAGNLYKHHAINYKKELAKFFTSKPLLFTYLLLLILIFYAGSINNFFVADDFTWLRWAATAAPSDLLKYFVDAKDFFYRPLDKTIVYFLYMLFSFQPQGYHIFILFVHFLTTMGVYLVGKKIFNNKLLAFTTALLFALHPAHAENMFWFSTLSVGLSTLFIVYTVNAYLNFRQNDSIFNYILAILFSLLAFVSYELAVVIPFVLLVVDIFVTKRKISFKTYLPFISLFILYFVIRFYSHAFVSGGDYSYNMMHFVPNVIGNYFGYIGLFLGGLSFIPFYESLREGLRVHWAGVSFIALLIFATLGIWGYNARKHLIRICKNKDFLIIILGLAFAFASLLPFLPLGNIAPRYLYLASIGFSLSFIYLLWVLLDRVGLSRVYKTLFLLLAMVLLIISYYVQNQVEQARWTNAGKLTKSTLTYFRTGYESFTPSTQVYIVNTPVKQQDVWVFPVGLLDGIWFIYREHMPSIHQVDSLDEAKKAKASQPTGTYIFMFNNKGVISEVK